MCFLHDGTEEVRALRAQIATLTQEKAALEARGRAQLVLLRKIADAKDRMDWWRELDQFLNALDALAPRPRRE